MSTVKEILMLALVARVGAAAKWKRQVRSHNRKLIESESPAVRVYEMKDELSPTARMGNPCRRDRELTVRIAITVRSDAGREMLDAYWNAVQAKLAAVWPDGVTIKEGPSVWDDEIADNDVNELVQEVTLCYATAPWRLDVPAT